MPAYARREIVDDGEVGVYHCTARCVRQAYLCGQDESSGQDFEHRKTWVEHRLETLASIFAIEIHSYAVMSNHLHIVLRIRPDLVESWTKQDVAMRIHRLSLRRFAEKEPDPERSAEAVNALAADPKRLKEARKRLKSLSWFMKYLCEHISRKANAEEGRKGRFWEGRFGSKRLHDEAAMLACSMYVDLNPIRANLAQTPEQSRHTSAFDRIRELRAKTAEERASKRKGRRSKRQRDKAKRRRPVNPWLSEFTLLEGASEALPNEARKSGDKPAKVTAADVKSMRENPAPRASDRGFLPMSLESYLKLLDWTGRQLREGKRGAIPSDLAPILERLQIRAENWIDTVTHFGRWFKRAAGRGASLTAAAAAIGRRWFQGVRQATTAFT